MLSVLAFRRTHEKNTLLCVFNMSAGDAEFRAKGRDALLERNATVAGDVLHLGAYGIWIGRV